MKHLKNKLSAFLLMLMCMSATMQAEIVHHTVCNPTSSSRGFTRECWENTETGKFYTDENCEEELVYFALAKAVTYVKLPESPVTGGTEDKFNVTEHKQLVNVNDETLDLNWSASTTYVQDDSDGRYVQFTVKGSNVANARIVCFIEQEQQASYNFVYYATLSVNGSDLDNNIFIDSYDIGRYENAIVIPLPNLKEGDVVKFNLSPSFYRGDALTFNVSLEYNFASCTQHEYPAGSAICSICGHVKEHKHTYDEGICTQCGALDLEYFTVHHEVCEPTLSTRGFNVECWENTYAHKFYSDADMTQEIKDEALARAVTYAKLSENPVTETNKFNVIEQDHINNGDGGIAEDIDLNWSASTYNDEQIYEKGVTPYADFTVKEYKGSNARMVWFRNNPEEEYGRYTVEISVNGTVVFTKNNNSEYQGIFVVSLPDLKRNDVVRFAVKRKNRSWWGDVPTFKASLEYNIPACTHEYPEGSAICSICGHVKEHEHTYDERICTQCGAHDLEYFTVHHEVCEPTLSTRGFNVECWEDTYTHKFYSDADMTQEIKDEALARAVTYTKLSENPVTETNKFNVSEQDHINNGDGGIAGDIDLNWSASTSNDYQIYENGVTPYADFTVKEYKGCNARMVWFRNNPETEYGRYTVEISVNGTVVFTKNNNSEYQGIFVVSLPDLKKNDVVRFAVKQKNPSSWEDVPTFKASLEYNTPTCTHEYPEGSAICSICGYVKEHEHTYDEGICSQCGVPNLEYFIVHHQVCEPTPETRGFNVECWENTYTHKFYSDAACTQEIKDEALARAVTYAKLSENPVTRTNKFSVNEQEHINKGEAGIAEGLDLNWSASTYISDENRDFGVTRYADFTVKEYKGDNARMVWFRNALDGAFGRYYVEISVNGTVVYSKDNDEDYEGVFVVSLPALKRNDVVRFAVKQTAEGWWAGGPTFKASLEYNSISCPNHEYPVGSAICSICGYVKEHDHTYDEGICTQCGVRDQEYFTIHHEKCEPTLESRGFTVECWEEKATGKFYSDEDCTEELVGLALVKAVTYAKLPENPVTEKNMFDVFESDRLIEGDGGIDGDLDLNWSASTSIYWHDYDYDDDLIRYADFTVNAPKGSNARMVWFRNNPDREGYGRYDVEISVNGKVVYSKNNDEDYQGLFVVSLPDLKWKDVVRFAVKKTENCEFFGPTFKASLEYNSAPCTEHEYQEGSAICSICDYVKEHEHTYDEGFCTQCGALDMTYFTIHHEVCEPTPSTCGFTRECWEEKATGKFYSDLDCTQELRDFDLAKTVTYAKLSENPITETNGFSVAEQEHVDDGLYFNWSASTTIRDIDSDYDKGLYRYVDFTVKAARCENARMVWFRDRRMHRFGKYPVEISVNGKVVYSNNNDYEYDGVTVVSLPDLKRNDVVRFAVKQTAEGEQSVLLTFKASLEYNVSCSHKFQAGGAICSQCGYVVSHEHTYGETEICSLCGAPDPSKEISTDVWTITDGVNKLVVADDITIKKLYYTRNFPKANQWQALYVPFEMEPLDWGYKFDVAAISNFHEYINENGETENVELEVRYVKNKKLLPNIPYLIRAKEAGEQTIVLNNATLKRTEVQSISCSSTERKYTFTGTYDAIDGLQSKDYIYVSDGKLCKADDDTEALAAMRWYLTIENRGSMTYTPSPGLAKSMSIHLIGEDEATGIEDIKVVSSPASNHKASDFYSITGVKLTKPQKGINIINGKKVFVK